MEELEKLLEAIKAKQEEIEKAFKNSASREDVEAMRAELDKLKEQKQAAELKALEDKLEEQKKIMVKQGEEITKLKKGEISTDKTKTFNDTLTEVFDKNHDDIQKFFRKETNKLSMEIARKTVGDMYTSNVDGTRYGEILRPGIIELPKRRVHMRDIMAGGSVGPGNSYTFMRQNGTGEGSIATVAETGTKAQKDYDLKEETVQIECIAGFVRVSRKAMHNVPGLISFLNSRLPEDLMKTEDAQILYGDGATPNIKGIFTSGNFVESTSTATKLSEKILDDLALFEDTYERYASAILMRPVNFWGFFKETAPGSGEYNLPQNVVIVNGMLFIGGIPVKPTTAINSGYYGLGDFIEGAQFLPQENMRIEFFEQDADNVTKNKVTIRIEETACLPVYGSDYFMQGTVPA